MPSKDWQAVHILIGYAICAGVLVAFHGTSVLRQLARGRALFVLLGGTGFFLLFWYYGRMDSWDHAWDPHVPLDASWRPLYSFVYFSLCAVFFRLLLPFLGARLALGLPPAALGLSARRNPHPPAVHRVGWVYLALFLGVLPFVVYASGTQPFQDKYPLCHEMISPEGGIALSHFLVYEAFYLLIFVSGESFWRGFLAFGTERDLGLYGLCFMVVPYVTSHFGKPLPETLGAIATGMVLGLLALKHRSVWLGVAIHYAIAVSTDLFVIAQAGRVIYAG
ncbi:MAG: hypothetical protein H6745_03100 [Deltaproteobacteria bacterium]|nr:hypothetical protein [Deltaproteobacteria bacterium]